MYTEKIAKNPATSYFLEITTEPEILFVFLSMIMIFNFIVFLKYKVVNLKR